MNKAGKKPSSKIIALSIICLALISSVLINKFSPKSEGGNALVVGNSPTVTLEVTAKEDTTDTDLDGLRDWQEVLWQSDPNNRDSDGDGTEDGKEIEEGRNPSIAGPNDKVSDLERPATNTVVYSGVEKNSLTDKLSKNLFGLFMQTKQGGGTFDENSANEIVANAAEIIPSKNILENRYTAAAIVTFPDNDLVKAQVYGENLGLKYIAMLYEIKNGPQDMAYISKEYSDLARELSLMAVPSSLLSTHVSLLNNLYNSSLAFDQVAASIEDPIEAMIAVKTYKTLADEQPILFTTIATYLRRNAIIFNDAEVSALWEKI